MEELQNLRNNICIATNKMIGEYIDKNPLPTDFDVDIISNHVNREKIKIYCECEKFMLNMLGIEDKSNAEYIAVIKKINEKLKQYQLHEFFDIDRFNVNIINNMSDDDLHENWIKWYSYKLFLCELDTENAQKELDLILDSKIEFYEYIGFMTSDQRLGDLATKFYKKQLELIDYDFCKCT